MNDRLVELLRESRTKRIPLEALRRCFRTAYPEFSDNPERDRLLLEALRKLVGEGFIALPSDGSWEKFGHPPMPKWASLVSPLVSQAFDWASVPWVPELGFWVELLPRQLEIARSINEFLLRRRGTLLPVPLNERSAEIFGDEKRLASIASGDFLFGGRLPLSVIGAFHVATPLPYRAASAPGRPVLILENHHSYWSFGEWNVKAKQYSAVVYGSGNEFEKSGNALDQVLSETGATGAEYLGDLDWRGLSIPAHFNAKRRASGQSGVAPAERFYAWLVTHGKRQLLDHSATPVVSADSLDWLTEALRADVDAMLRARFRIAQECLGYEVLVREFLG